MRVAFVQTYPIYHDLLSTDAWLARANRDRWMPGVLANMGPEVELWAADHTTSMHRSTFEGFGAYPIRLFESVPWSRQTKKHYSDALVDHARRFDADLYILKGTDGGVGVHLIRQYLQPAHKPFVFVIGGKFYTRHVPEAALVFYETEAQRQALRHPGWRIWRRPVPDDRLLHLPKSIDTELFRPMPDVRKEWDIVSVGRLIERYKSYDALGALAEEFDVAVVGGGPAADTLQTTYPQVDWVGKVPNREVPIFLNRGRTFMHAGLNDYFPRVIAEAAACGLPCFGFAEAIADDVIPPGCGRRLPRSNYAPLIREVLQDETMRRAMSTNARRYAVESLGMYSSRAPQQEMLERLGFA